MGAKTSPLKSRKRSSSQPLGSSDDEDGDTVKRRRVPSHDKELANADENLADTSAGVSESTQERLPGTPKPSECGIITKVYCENFMCHRKFTAELCRNVNFIHGQNGSGKSAILAAIQICLGAGARRTHRAGNLKELVRKDSTGGSAKIRVTLLNKGVDAYEHDVYGDTISVERTIALHGGFNGYKLYDNDMRERSRSKKDLDDMLDKLNIQVENPVAILDQEEAKKFLTGKSEDKYNFFLKATELERIDRTYVATVDKVEELNKQTERMEQSLDGDIELVEQTKKKWDEHQEIEKLKNKLRGHQEALAWAMYKEADETLQNEQDQIKAFRERVEKRQDELTQAEAATQDDEGEETAKRNRLEDLNKEAEGQAQLKLEVEKELKLAIEPKKALERNVKALGRELATAERSLASANRRLQEKRNEILAREGNAESEAAQRTQRLNAAEENLKTSKQEYDETKQAVSDFYRKYEELEPHVDQAKQFCATTMKQVSAIEGRIRSLESSSGNSLAMFGQRCAQVKGAVDRCVQQRRFQGPVVGPIGAYVKIVPGKEALASLAELAIGGGALDRFIVTNDHDRKVFQEIRNRVGCRNDCGIFQVAPHPKYNIPQPPVQGIETVASVLNVTDDLVFNCLVDNCKIDERALSRSREESERLLLIENGNGRYAIRGKIKNVFFIPSGDNWSVSRDGNLNVVANEKQLRQTIGVDKTAAIAEGRREAEAAKQELAVRRQEESRLEHQHHENQKNWNIKKRQMATIQAKINDLAEEIEKTKTEQESATNFDTDTSDLEQDVGEAQQVVDDIRDRESRLKEEIVEKEPVVQELKAKVQEVEARNNKILKDMEEASGDLTAYMSSLSQREEKLEKKRNRLKEYQAIIERQEQKIVAVTKDVEKFLKHSRRLAFERVRKQQQETQTAEDVVSSEDSQLTQEPTEEELEAIEICDVPKEPSYYQTRVEKFTAKIEHEKERRNATKEDAVAAYEKYLRAKELLDSKMERINEVKMLSEKLSEDTRQRRKRWMLFRQHIADTTSFKFDEILNRKGSSGTADFDHDDKRLDLVVQKDSADANSQQKDVKALSGGERSYTTIALLLALGESLETPFRILDEFDVFLDPVTRKLTIDSLIQMAKEMSHRQFIFITPQDVSNVETDPMLKVLKMMPPARNNVAGGPSQQTLEFSQS